MMAVRAISATTSQPRTVSAAVPAASAAYSMVGARGESGEVRVRDPVGVGTTSMVVWASKMIIRIIRVRGVCRYMHNLPPHRSTRERSFLLHRPCRISNSYF
ncbi:hypothetical protein BJX65DRAFT_264795 [Aspergillus insuetus]